MDEKVILKTEELTKTYWNGLEKTVALNKVSLELLTRQLLAVYGPSGSGKTTLLFLLGGFDLPTSGRILINGTDITEMDEAELSTLRRRSIGFVFQNYNLVEELTVRENVALTMMFEGKTAKEMTERTSELLEGMKLGGKKNHRPSQLSAGEQQRVAIARALANKPRLVLMDEPTGNLDIDGGREIMQLVTRISRVEGTTFVIATHNQEIVRNTSSRLFLKGGQATNESSAN